jgi:hypothetical protein
MPSWLPGFGLKYLIPDASHSRNFHMLGSVKSDPTVLVGDWRFWSAKPTKLSAIDSSGQTIRWKSNPTFRPTPWYKITLWRQGLDFRRGSIRIDKRFR